MLDRSLNAASRAESSAGRDRQRLARSQRFGVDLIHLVWPVGDVAAIDDLRRGGARINHNPYALEAPAVVGVGVNVRGIIIRAIGQIRGKLAGGAGADGIGNPGESSRRRRR